MVPTVTLDDFFAGEEWPSISLIKMDIEGAETAALQGMRELCRRNPEMQLVMEFNSSATHWAGSSWEALASNLRTLGFGNSYIIERRLKPVSLTHAFSNSRALHNLLLRQG